MSPTIFTYKDTAVVTPNSGTPGIRFLWADLRPSRWLSPCPPWKRSRYFSVQFCDGNTFNYGYIGSRGTGNDAGDYLLAGPDWNGLTLPLRHQRRVFHSTTEFSLVLFRTAVVPVRTSLVNVMKIQSGYQVHPLSAYISTGPHRPPRRPSTFPPIQCRTWRKRISSSILRLHLAVRARRAGRK